MKFVWALSFFVWTNSWALLPPFCQDSKEILALLSDPYWKDYSGESFLSLQKTEQGYLLETTHYCFPITLSSTPPLDKTVGPLSFSFTFLSPLRKEETPPCACTTSPSP